MTPGATAEELFRSYLRVRRIPYAYELPAGSGRPDFWLELTSQPVCEVGEISASVPHGGSALDVYKPIRKAIKRKAGQGRPLAGVRPYVVVLWAPYWPMDDVAVSGAMFGRVQFVMPFDPATGTADSDRGRVEFGRDAALHNGQHRHISAVSVIRRFNRGLRAAQDEVAERLKPLRAVDPRTRAAETIFEVFNRRHDEGLLSDDDMAVRLVTYHNAYASLPLPLDVFDGPFDEQLMVTEGGAYTTVFEGDRVGRLPT